MVGRLSIKRYINLLAISAKMDLVWILRDIKFAILAISCDIIANISTIAGVFLIAVRFGGIGGLSQYEVLFMLSYSTIITGIFTLFCGGNNGHISRIIGRGQLEHMFIQPISIPSQLLTMGFMPFSGSSNLISGIIIMSIAINILSLNITSWWLISIIINLFITMVIIIAQSYLYASVTFYAPVASEEISSYVIDALGYIGNFPLTGMPAYLKFSLVTIIPSGLMAWFPSLIMLGKSPTNYSVYYPLIIAIFFALTASILFKKGLNYYVKKGSNRYSSGGFRR